MLLIFNSFYFMGELFCESDNIFLQIVNYFGRVIDEGSGLFMKRTRVELLRSYDSVSQYCLILFILFLDFYSNMQFASFWFEGQFKLISFVCESCPFIIDDRGNFISIL